ncbi:MAG TPA: acyltransferase domain-containing protein [Solirubrobacterales bacterium]|jgi:acyl transferase domain-containing protein
MQQKTNHLSAAWVLTAPSAEKLRERARALLEHLDGTPAPELAMIFSALATEAAPQPHRAVLLGGSRDDLKRGLEDLAAGRSGNDLISGKARDPARVAFVFPPLRAEFEGMALDLLNTSAVFREQMRACEAALAPFAEWCLDDVLRGRPDTPSLYRLDVSQHALFATCTSLARFWEALGVRPEAVLGHSLGEVPAAAISGSLTLGEAARVTNTWGRSAMRFENQGEMGAIAMPAAELEKRIAPWHGRLWISAFNSPGMTSVSGEKEAVEELLAALAADGIAGRPMGISAPGHSPAVTVIHQWFAEELSSVSPRPGTIPFYSGVVGREVDQTGLDALYWSSNLSQRVYFESALRALLADGYDVLVEVGPRRVLADVLTETIADAGVDAIVVGTLDQTDPGYLLWALAELFVRGVDVDWEAICGEEPLIPAEFWPVQRGVSGDGVALAALLADIPDIEREAVALGLVREEVARVIGLSSAAEIDPGRPFMDLGFDSPKAVDLRNRLIEATGLDLSTTVAFDYPTPRDVARKLLLELDGEDESTAAKPTGPIPDEEAVEAIDELDLAGLLELGQRQRDELEEVS